MDLTTPRWQTTTSCRMTEPYCGVHEGMKTARTPCNYRVSTHHQQPISARVVRWDCRRSGHMSQQHLPPFWPVASDGVDTFVAPLLALSYCRDNSGCWLSSLHFLDLIPLNTDPSIHTGTGVSIIHPYKSTPVHTYILCPYRYSHSSIETEDGIHPSIHPSTHPSIHTYIHTYTYIHTTYIHTTNKRPHPMAP